MIDDEHPEVTATDRVIAVDGDVSGQVITGDGNVAIQGDVHIHVEAPLPDATPPPHRTMATTPDGFVHRRELDEVRALLCAHRGEDRNPPVPPVQKLASVAPRVPGVDDPLDPIPAPRSA